SLSITASLATIPSYKVSASTENTEIITTSEVVVENPQTEGQQENVTNTEEQTEEVQADTSNGAEQGTVQEGTGSSNTEETNETNTVPQKYFSILDVKIDKTVANLGESVKVEFDVFIPEGKVVSEFKANYKMPSGTTHTIILNQVSPNKFQGEVSIPYGIDYVGTWILDTIKCDFVNDMGDYGGAYLYPKLVNGNFVAENPDKTPPVMENFYISDTVLFLNEDFEIRATVKDNVQVNKVIVVLQSPVTKENYAMELAPSDLNNGEFLATLYFNEGLDYGTWKVIGVYVEDGAGNYTEYLNDGNQVSPLLKNAKLELVKDVKAGWNNINGTWYFYNGNIAIGLTQHRGWLANGGKWYYMNNFGQMQTGWVNDNNKWYFMDGSGAMKTGWLQNGGKWYLLNSSGERKIGWVQNGGKWYYFANNGQMHAGWLLLNGQWYLLDGSGAMRTGWVQSSGKWYYLYGSGQMAKSTTIGGYKLDASGAWIK
ncbi:MAG: hypothetical protein RR262_18305, partial [Clostridium sp.]